MSAWRINDAECSCDAVFDRALGGEPQIVTRFGVPSLVVITYDEYCETHAAPCFPSGGNAMLDFFRSCPSDLSTLDLTRERDVGANRSEAFA